MDYRELAPPSHLAPFVRCLWTLTSGAGPCAVEPILPDGCMELVVHWGDRFTRIGDQGAPTLQPRALFVGQLRAPFLVAPTGRIGVVGARFRIGGASPWLAGATANSLAGSQLAIEDVEPRAAEELVERVSAAASDAARVDVLAQWLTERMDRARVDARALAAAEWLESTRGAASVDALAERLALSPRHLERLFDRHVGLRPKLVGRILRFQAFLDAARDPAHARGAELAARAGYADQSHLIRDFREFSGTTPRAWLAAHTPIAARLAGFDT